MPDFDAQDLIIVTGLGGLWQTWQAWETNQTSGADYNTADGSADVKGVPPPDGGTPKTPTGFFDKVGDAIYNASKPKTDSEAFSDTVKWVAIALAAVGAVYIVHKVL